jgi:hypothetical protein
MKERWIGVGLGVGAALALGIVWTDSAQAFSLGSTVTVENFLRIPGTNTKIPYVPDPPRLPVINQGPQDVKVGSDPTLTEFGGIWDIALSNGLISFSLNSPVFTNVTSGEDVYQFQISDFGPAGPFSLLKDKNKDKFLVTFCDSCIDSNVPTSSSAVSTGPPCFQAGYLPFVQVKSDNQLDVIFPWTFAAGDFTKGPGSLKVFIAVDVSPTPVPTPALLPGLVGMGLAALRKRRQDSQPADDYPE